MPQFLFDEVDKPLHRLHSLKRGRPMEPHSSVPACQLNCCLSSTRKECCSFISSHYSPPFPEGKDTELGPPPSIGPVLFRQHAIDRAIHTEPKKTEVARTRPTFLRNPGSLPLK